GHLIAVHFDDGVRYLDLGHRVRVFHWGVSGKSGAPLAEAARGASKGWTLRHWRFNRPVKHLPRGPES
ncbi:MAG: hypothetical protein O9272_16045, partial [Brevundimonas sp.]|nr:hypothetical protein [Brevundimonas sp.]